MGGSYFTKHEGPQWVHGGLWAAQKALWVCNSQNAFYQKTGGNGFLQNKHAYSCGILLRIILIFAPTNCMLALLGLNCWCKNNCAKNILYSYYSFTLQQKRQVACGTFYETIFFKKKSGVSFCRAQFTPSDAWNIASVDRHLIHMWGGSECKR